MTQNAAARVYRLRRISSSTHSDISFLLGLPVAVGTLLDEAEIRMFTVELTEDGILYRPANVPEAAATRPAWLTKENT